MCESRLGTVPKDLLAAVAVPPSGGVTPMTYAVQATTTFTVGSYSVAVSAAIGSGFSVDLQ